MEKQLAGEKWYHGLLPREDIKMMLTRKGDFLVRTTEPVAGQPRALVLSVMYDPSRGEEQGIKHFVIRQHQGGKVSIEKFTFDSIATMIIYHLKQKESISKQSEIILETAIGRQPWELNHVDIECTKKLGEGAFGEVHQGKLKLRGKIIDVAVKVAKLEVLTKEQIKEIMREARLMRNFDNPNVVKFYGVAAGQEPLMMVMELANNGALDSYLQKNNVPIEKKLEMIVQSAWGIEYLHSKEVLHCDIAARNCLYGDNKVKISDFGLAREGTVYQMDPHHRVPIRWLAPETLRNAIYTQKTDVFAYGIMCWEILNNGIEPYPGMSVAEVNVKVKEGYRMRLPLELNPDVKMLIEIKCWSDNPNERFVMKDISKNLERILKIDRKVLEPVEQQQKKSVLKIMTGRDRISKTQIQHSHK